MKVGKMVGIDLIKVDRIDKLKEKKNFFNKIFTINEQKYLQDRFNRNKHIAGIIACKEAVSKSFRVGISEELGFKDIEILHDEKRAPYINTSLDKIKKIMEDKKISNVSISISHDGDYAIAISMLS